MGSSIADWNVLSLAELEQRGSIKLFRGKVISQKDIDRLPGDYPIYSSSVNAGGLFGTFGEYMFDEELITWSIDGGGNFFYRPKHRFSVTNVCGYIRVRTPSIDARYLAYQLQQLHSRKVFDYTLKAHPSVIRGAYKIPLPSTREQHAVAKALSDVDRLLEALEAVIAKKRAIKQAAMQQLLTGKTRLPGFNGTWETKPLDSLGKWRGGMTPSMRNPDYWNAGDIPWISSADVKSSRLTDTAQHVTSQAVRDGAAIMVAANSIVLVTRSGILRKHLPVALIERTMAVNQDIKALIPHEAVSGEFLLHALTGFGDQILARCLKAGTTVESVEFVWLKAFAIPVPPREEQGAIATILSHMDAEIAALESRTEKTRAIKQGMMQQLLSGRVRLVKPALPETNE